MRWLKKLASALAFPDFAVFALPAYYKKINEVLKSESVTAMLVSAPSHSLLLLTVLLSKRRASGVKFIADYRDGWNARRIFARKGFFSGWLSRCLEGAVFKSVNNALFATNSMRSKTEALFPELALGGKSVTVMNGYPEKFSQGEHDFKAERSSNKFRIGYFGVVNDQVGNYRNIEPVLTALNILRERGFDFSLELYGDVRISKIDFSTYDFIRVKGSVSHAEALSIMRGMDCLLMYHVEREGAREVITGKFFDYVSARRPILCVSPLDMEGAVMVENGQFGRVADFDDIEKICQAFSDIYNGIFVMDAEGSFCFSRESQYSKILPLLK